MSGAYKRLRDARDANNRDQFAERSARARLTITRVESDSLGNVRQAWGTEDGAGEFPIMSMGHAIEIGEIVIGEREGGNVANPSYRYVAHLESDLPAAGMLRLEPGPPPNFATVWHTERIETINGASFARITIYFQIDPSYSPSKVYVSHKPSALPDWTDQAVPFVMTTADQAAELAVPYASGVSVDIQLSAEYQYAYSPSTPSSTRVLTTPTDGVTPGAVTSLAVDVTIPGIMKLKAAGTFDRSRYIGIRYEIATAIGGPAIATPVVDGEYEYYAAAGGTFYVAAAPISRSNVLGTRYPGVSTFAGPYTVAVAAAAPDNTAPAAWAAPTVTNFVRQRADGSQAGFIRIAFPVRGTYEPDYAATVVRMWNGTTFDERTIPYRGSPPDTQEYQVDFGTWTVWIYAIDASQNKSALSTSASTTIAAPGLPAAAGSPTIRQIALANEVQWTMPTGAETVQVERSDDAGGTVNVVTVYEGQGTRFLDLHTELTTFPTSYYYRIRGRNFAGDGAWSSRIIGTLTALSGTVLAANTVQGDRVIANTLDANTIKTNTILTALLKTAGLLTTRWELEGATGGAGAMQFRGIEFIGGSDKKRVQIDGLGFTVFGDAAQSDITMNRNSSGRGQLVAQGVTIGHDGTRPFLNMDLSASAQFKFTGPSNTVYFEQGTFGAYNAIYARSTNGTIGDPIVAFYHDVGGGTGLEKLALSWDGIASAKSGDGGVGASFKREVTTANGWLSNVPIRGTKLQAGAASTYAVNHPFVARNPLSLNNTIGSAVEGMAVETVLGDGTINALQTYIERSVFNSDVASTYYKLRALWNGGGVGGGIDLGFAGTSGAGTPWFALRANEVLKLQWDHANNRIQTGNLFVSGALSKTSGSFVIPDPTPGHEGDELRHCFVEGPTRGENLYTYVVSVDTDGARVADSEGNPVEGATIGKGGEIVFALPDYWRYLNERPRVWVQNTGEDWGEAKARVSADGTIVTVRRRDLEVGGEWTILIMGTRKDTHARAWWDRRGVRKTAAQRWDNGNTVERRQAALAARQARDERGQVPTRRGPLNTTKGVYFPGFHRVDERTAR